mmetsp:Transcript_4241/g.10917  ORF Transcript_4241/g.10917 Transcript_4241/m.10917 type:complete len:200 (-) Transcript_4241:4-603(-)
MANCCSRHRLGAADGQVLRERLLGDCALVVAVLHKLAVLEHHQRGKPVHLVLLDQVGVWVGLNLDHLEVGVLLVGPVHDGGDQLARPAPRGPVVHQDQLLRLQNLILEGVLVDLDDGAKRQGGRYAAAGERRGPARGGASRAQRRTAADASGGSCGRAGKACARHAWGCVCSGGGVGWRWWIDGGKAVVARSCGGLCPE